MKVVAQWQLYPKTNYEQNWSLTEIVLEFIFKQILAL